MWFGDTMPLRLLYNLLLNPYVFWTTLMPPPIELAKLGQLRRLDRCVAV